VQLYINCDIYVWPWCGRHKLNFLFQILFFSDFISVRERVFSHFFVCTKGMATSNPPKVYFSFASIFICLHVRLPPFSFPESLKPFHLQQWCATAVCDSDVRQQRTMWSPTATATRQWISFEMQWLHEPPSTVVCDEWPPKEVYIFVIACLVVCTRHMQLFFFFTDINLRLSILHMI